MHVVACRRRHVAQAFDEFASKCFSTPFHFSLFTPSHCSGPLLGRGEGGNKDIGMHVVACRRRHVAQAFDEFASKCFSTPFHFSLFTPSHCSGPLLGRGEGGNKDIGNELTEEKGCTRPLQGVLDLCRLPMFPRVDARGSVALGTWFVLVPPILGTMHLRRTG